MTILLTTTKNHRGNRWFFVLNTALSGYAFFGIDAYACQSPDLACGGWGIGTRTPIYGTKTRRPTIRRSPNVI